MNEKSLVKSDGDHVIQSFPLYKGRVNLTSGTYSNIKMIHCVDDGAFTITWDDNTTSVIDMVYETDFSISNDVKSITINTGKFHIA